MTDENPLVALYMSILHEAPGASAPSLIGHFCSNPISVVACVLDELCERGLIEIEDEEKYAELLEYGVVKVLDSRQDNDFLTIDPEIHAYPTLVQQGIEAYIQVGLDELLPQDRQQDARKESSL